MPLTEYAHSRRKRVLRQCLGTGILLICFGLYNVRTIWTFQSSLQPLKGTINKANTFVNTVTGYRGHKSQKAELIFFLNGYKQEFHLSENIGDDHTDEKYESILQGLLHANTVTVWIRKDALAEEEPKVFQIDEDEKINLLDFQSATAGERSATFLFLIVGSVFIMFFLWGRFPGKWNKFFS